MLSWVRMGRRALLASIALSGAILLPGCATYTNATREVRSHYISGNYDSALTKLDTSGLKEDQKSALLYHLEKAMILDRQGERAEARKLLLAADRIADKLYTTSVLNTAASFVVNDSSQDYSGEDYEKVAIHTMLALSFIEDENFASAGVEARKINTVLQALTAAYDDAHNRYHEDAFARYLAGIIHEVRGDVDDAIIDYRKALSLYSSEAYAPFYDGGVPRGLLRALYLLADQRGRSSLCSELAQAHPDVIGALRKEAPPRREQAQLIVLHEAGSIAVKQASEFIYPIGRQVVRFSFPVIQRSRHEGYSVPQLEVDGRSYTADNVADLTAIAHYALEDKRGRLLLKGAARLLAKAQITEQAYQSLGPLGGIAANIYTAATETADTRSWTLLPETFYVSRLWLPPGKHTITTRFAGRLHDVRTLHLKPGEIKVIRDIGQGARGPGKLVTKKKPPS